MTKTGQSITSRGNSWARPRGAQLSAGYTVPTPPLPLYSRRLRRLYSCTAPHILISPAPHCPSATRCDLLNQTWLRTDTDTRQTRLTNHEPNSQLGKVHIFMDRSVCRRQLRNTPEQYRLRRFKYDLIMRTTKVIHSRASGTVKPHGSLAWQHRSSAGLRYVVP